MKCSRTILLFVFLVFISSCKVSKFLGEDEILYKKSIIVYADKSKIEDEGALESIIQEKLYPKPNKKFLGLFYTKLWIHEKVEPKENREKGFKHWLQRKFGEKPILLKDVDSQLMSKIIDKTMQDNGYFSTSTIPLTAQAKSKGALVFKIEHGNPIQIDSIIFPSSEVQIDSLIANFPDYKTAIGQTYNLKKLQEDRLSLAKEIRSYGYFDFDEKDIYYIIDTSIVGDNVHVHFKIKAPNDGGVHRKYYINDVIINTTAEASDVDMFGDEKNFKQEFMYRGYTFKQDSKFIGKRALVSNILIEPKSVFSVADYNYTLERLNNLGLFNYVIVNYAKSDKDSLRVNIKLTPGKYQSFRASIEATTSNRSFLGSSLSLTYNNRNLFQGAENLEIKASAGTEFQFINNKAVLNILNVDFKVGFGVPRLISFFRSGKIKSGIPPKTTINLEENYQQWLQYYTINSFNVNYRYDWRTRKAHHHVLTPAFFNVISLLNTTPEFDDILANNPNLQTSFNSSVIIGRSYSFSLSTQKDQADKRYISFSGFTEIAGNGNYIAAKIFNNRGTMPYEVFSIPFSQYAKFEGEIKHHWKINRTSSIVSRFNSGIGIAYGNSEVLPYIKQFYMGGPNTIRAFPFRSLGPGEFSSANDANGGVINPIEQAGDIKLLMNAEYRFQIYKFIHGAAFLDAGNVWLRRADDSRANSQFQWDEFYRQIALGTGIGLRLDFDFFAIRADLGIPVYKPYNNDGEKWITEFPEQGFKDWRKKNWVWNIAIGYPF